MWDVCSFRCAEHLGVKENIKVENENNSRKKTNKHVLIIMAKLGNWLTSTNLKGFEQIVKCKKRDRLIECYAGHECKEKNRATIYACIQNNW